MKNLIYIYVAKNIYIQLILKRTIPLLLEYLLLLYTDKKSSLEIIRETKKFIENGLKMSYAAEKERKLEEEWKAFNNKIKGITTTDKKGYKLKF